MTTQYMTQVSPSSRLAGNGCRDHQHKTYSFEDTLQLIRRFHGFPAPGLVLGTKMVSYALDHVPQDILFDAICETSSCLPDAVQILTLCTIGNAWLKVIDMGNICGDALR